MNRVQKSIQADKGVWLSLFTYILLSILKLTIGKIGDSEGLWADGLNNSTDILSSIAILIGLKISRKPPDHNHLYGHSRAETISSLIAAFIMFTVGIQVIINGIQTFFKSSVTNPDWLAGFTALGCAIIMYSVSHYNLKLSKKINSASLKAVAYDNRSDAFVSMGAFIGIMGTNWGIDWLDILIAVIVGLLICKTGWDIFKESSYSLSDGFDTNLLSSIHETIASTPGVIKITELKGRMHGSQILIEATITVNPTLNVVESHAITEKIEERLLKEHKVSRAFIHIEPYQIKENA
ncbi:cation diffusion facilitator family transporter [Cytobacillus sp. Hz8]|uniref:cation diffusion facilitator family transporter n=1 Tax=Cytobacillus sp. Hz8 TaxID=3347168 RepID=UPI0035DAFEE1